MNRGNRVLQDERETWVNRVPKESRVRYFVMPVTNSGEKGEAGTIGRKGDMGLQGTKGEQG